MKESFEMESETELEATDKGILREKGIERDLQKRGLRGSSVR